MIRPLHLPLRLAPALVGAVLITMAVFLFMQHLISQSENQQVTLPIYENVQIIQPEEEPEPPEQPPVEASDKSAEQPSLAALEISTPAPSPATVPALEVAELNLAVDIGSIQGSGDSWSAPMSGEELALSGKDASGYVQVVPFDTRKPNVPEVAWQNKINGWVLVAFSLDSKGRTGNIRVLDANPRGVFEEKVIAAVKDWRYSVSVKGRYSGNIVLTQRIEVLWENYPYNIPNVD